MPGVIFMRRDRTAERLGISRKTYYEWENRAMEGMLCAVQSRPTRRPGAQTDPQMEQLRAENQDLRQQVQVLEQSLVIGRMLAEADSRAKIWGGHGHDPPDRAYHRQTRTSFRRLLAVAGVPRASVLRQRRGLAQVGSAPRRDFPSLQASPLERAARLCSEVAALHHGRERSRVTGALYARVRSLLSRRAFSVLVRKRRQNKARRQRAALARIRWPVPASVRAMDPGQLAGRFWNLASDLASRFRFDLTTAAELPARTIAGHVAALLWSWRSPRSKMVKTRARRLALELASSILAGYSWSLFFQFSRLIES